MRWKIRIKIKPKPDDVRRVRKFALFPKRALRELDHYPEGIYIIWLEHYVESQLYSFSSDHWGSGYKWVTIRRYVED